MGTPTKQTTGEVARASFSFSGLTTLANGTYVASSAVDLYNAIDSVTKPLDVIVTFEATPGTVSGNKQALVFCQTSMDGSNFTTGPTSGTTTTDQPNLKQIASLPLFSNSTQQRGEWSLLAEIGFIPHSLKLVIFNDSGAAFSAGAAYYTHIYGDSR